MSAAIGITVLVAIYGVSVFRHHATTPDMALAVKSGGADAGHEDHDDHDEHD
ncbi:MAG: hypothetical protein JRI70_03625, partial [Deltaproteobacteria bacterium]|nr:hypothetical protein [Deltaproteobacteria bacterium]